ncbi:restriction endonuclease subunit S [Merdimonas faecis]|uniref:restriction endonuclease subunit S n=1 Tax=Merdimonas faecis TaxID=1653435 RepID=UPI0022E8CB61|nr:restriction endonuclease subunit S [Merdimonas faecis]
MSKWEEKRLEDIIDVNPSVKLKKGESYPFIDIDKVSPTRRSVTNEEVKVYDGQSSSKFCNGDTVFSRITPCLENRKIAKVSIDGDAAFGSTEFYVFRAKQKKADARFTYYLTSSDAVVLPAINSMTGASGRQRADKRFIQRLKLNLPDLSTQERIADILSAYDDLIEANNRRIELLEQVAQELYKEWFVRFRFPGHEKAKFENGLPEGWNIQRLYTYGRIETGKTPSMKKKENYGNDVMFIKTPDMHGNTFVIKSEEMLSEGGHLTQPKKLLPPNSIMVTCIGSGGVVAINAEKAHTNQQINSIILQDSTKLEWLYFTCKSLKSTIELFGATGTTMTNLSKGKFERLKVINPDDALILQYHKFVAPMLDKIKSLMYQNQNLAAQRDLLLPRLMSGKLEV